MGRTLDHYICPSCKYNFQNVGSIDGDVKCKECDTVMEIYMCEEWLGKCRCPIEWETLNERTVKWDKEQTRHLRKRLGQVDDAP
jgi:hypothetical protein